MGLIKKHDIPLGKNNRWLTVVSKDEPDSIEILLEPSPNHFEPSKTYQSALFEARIPYTEFNVDNLEDEYEELINLGIDFVIQATEMGNVKIAVLDDTCGNKIQLIEML